MNLDRATLKKLVMEELERSLKEGFTTTGPDPANALSTGEIMRLVDAGMSVAGIDKTNLTDKMKSILGMKPDSESGFIYHDPGSPSRKSGPLSTQELMALMMADKDSSSDYKLSMDRLSSLDHSNLTDEELQIISTAG